MLAFLRRVPLFRHLEPAELRRIRDIAHPRRYRKRQLVFSKTESGDNLFVVRSGRVKVFAFSGARKRKTFAYIKDGGFFGEMALLNGKVRSASVMAMEPTELLCIGRKDFEGLLRDSQFNLAILRTLSQRLRSANEDIESLLFDGLTGRLCNKIVQLSKPRGGGTPRDIKMSRRELADVIGTTREPLARALGLLKRCGAIDVARDRIKVNDPEKLRGLGAAR